MVFDGGITLAFIVGTAAVSTFNAGLNFYRWLTGPDIRVPNRSNDNMREPLPNNIYSYIVYCDRSMEVYKKIIIDIDKLITKNTNNNIYNSDSSDDEVFEKNTHNINNTTHLDIISFSSRIPPRSNEVVIKRFMVEHYVFPSNTFKYNNITLTPLRTNGFIAGIEISSDNNDKLLNFINKYIENTDTLTYEN